MRPAPHTVFVALVVATVALSFGVPRAAQAQLVTTFSTVVPRACGLAVDAAGRMYVTSRAPNAKIYRCTPPDTTMELFASGFIDPIDMVFDDSGNLFVADYAGLVEKVTPAGVVSTFATPIANAGAITRDTAGNLYVGEYNTRYVIKVTPAGVKSTYIAGLPVALGSLALLEMEPDGTLYASGMNGVIDKIGPGGSPVTTFCSATGPVRGFVHDSFGAWFADTYDGQQLIQISAGGTVTTYGGAYLTPNPNTSVDNVYRVDGAPADARFNWPDGMLVFKNKIYIAEYGNHDIRMISYEPTPARSTSWGRLKATYR